MRNRYLVIIPDPPKVMSEETTIRIVNQNNSNPLNARFITLEELWVRKRCLLYENVKHWLSEPIINVNAESQRRVFIGRIDHDPIYSKPVANKGPTD
jgi:hypothetical protein